MNSSVELKKALKESIALDGKLESTLDSQRLGIEWELELSIAIKKHHKIFIKLVHICHARKTESFTNPT